MHQRLQHTSAKKPSTWNLVYVRLELLIVIPPFQPRHTLPLQLNTVGVCWVHQMRIFIGLHFLRAFGRLQKATLSCVPCVCLYVCLSVDMQVLVIQWTDFREILCLTIFRKSVEKTKFL